MRFLGSTDRYWEMLLLRCGPRVGILLLRRSPVGLVWH